MKASEIYSDPTMIECFGRSALWELFRRLRNQMQGFPVYSDPISEFHAAWIIFIAAKTPNSKTPRAIAEAIRAGTKLKCGDQNFIHWLGDQLAQPESLGKIFSVWIWVDAEFAEVRMDDRVLIFQGVEKAREVSQATQLSGQFLYDFAKKLNVKDESLEDETVFESEDESEDF